MSDNSTKSVFNYLLDHMLDIHRKKMRIVSAYSHDYDSYTQKLTFINSYIKSIEAFLDSSSKDPASTEIPFVILGSSVSVKRANTAEHFKVKIILPNEQTDAKTEGAAIYTCFSDWGYTLLLKKPGEHFFVGHANEEYIVEDINTFLESIPSQ